jgi:homoserine dehydrogenase
LIHGRTLVADPEIDVVVELIGGLRPAKEIVVAALEQGKSVVTANKQLLAEEAADVFGALERGRGFLGFEASVGGGIPCLAALREGLVGNRVQEVMGILNGTTNYI